MAILRGALSWRQILSLRARKRLLNSMATGLPEKGPSRCAGGLRVDVEMGFVAHAAIADRADDLVDSYGLTHRYFDAALFQMCQHHLNATAAQPNMVALHNLAVDHRDCKVGPVVAQRNNCSSARGVDRSPEDSVAFGVRWPESIRCRSQPRHRHKIDAIALPVPEPVARYRKVESILMCVQ